MKTVYQRLIESYIPWLVLGFLFAGSVFDAIVNTAELITPTVTYTGTASIFLVYFLSNFILKRYPLTWISQDGQRIYIRKLGTKPLIMFLGVLSAIWLPRLVVINPSNKADTVPTGAQPPTVQAPISTNTSSSTDIPTSKSGIINGCISVDSWSPYAETPAQFSFDPSIKLTPEPQTKCWYLYDWGIYVEEGSLLFKGEEVLKTGEYGISTPTTNNTVISFELDIDYLDKDDKIKIGIIPGSSNADTTGVSLVAWGTDGSRKILQIYRFTDGQYDLIPTRVVNGDGFESNSDALLDIAEDLAYEVKIEVMHARMNIFINGERLNFDPINVVYSDPRVWIGYELSIIGGTTSATITDFSIQNN